MNVKQHPKLYTVTHKAHKKSNFCPYNFANIFCMEEVLVMSLQFAKTISVAVTKMSNTNCVIIAFAIPPALSNAWG